MTSPGAPRRCLDGRRHDIDALRVFGCLAVFLFHCIHLFDPLPWHVKSPETFAFVLFPVAWMDAWIMPLFFFLSGAATFYSLKKRTAGQYLKERLLRLLLPLYAAGVLLLPPQYAFELITNRGFEGPLLEGMGRWFLTLYAGPSPFFLSFWSGHLWFLKFLFIISCLSLPLLLFLRRDGLGFESRLRKITAMRGGVFFFAPVSILVLNVGMPVAGTHSWSSLFHHMLLFVFGYISVMLPGFRSSAERNTLPALLGGIIGTAALLYMLFGVGYASWVPQPRGFRAFVYYCIAGWNTWCWILFFSGAFSRVVHSGGPLLARLGEAVMPFYMLHQTVLLSVAWVLVGAPLHAFAKFLLITTLSFFIIVALYEYVVRRFGVVSILFGMRRQEARGRR